MTLPPELSAKLFNSLSSEEIQAITQEITSLPPIAPEVRETVIDKFMESIHSGLQKAAILLTSLPAALGSKLLAEFTPGEATSLAHAIAGLGEVLPFTKRAVVKEFLSLQASASPYESLEEMVRERPVRVVELLKGWMDD